jgi:hypothetical protein
MRYIIIFILTVLFFVPQILTAQTAAQLETVTASSAVTCSTAAQFVLEGEDGAFEKAKSNGWLPKTARADEPINMGSLSFLLMKAYNLKGGFLYAIFPGPRYAFRAMVSESYIQSDSDPSMTVSGEDFLLILGRVLSAAGGEP